MVEFDFGFLKLPFCLGLWAVFLWALWRRMRKVDKRDFPDLLTGRVAVITGGSEGLGFEIAKELVGREAKVYIVSRSVYKLERAVNKLKCENSIAEGSDRVSYFQVDVADLNSVKNFADFFRKRETKLDFLINNAGLITSKRTSSPQEIDHVIATNYFGHFLLTELLLSHLNKSIFGGVVVNITSDMTSYMGSVDVIQPQKEFTKYSWDKFEQYYMNESYATSKKALEMHSQYLASACIGSVSNTRFFSANPGLLDTNISNNWPKLLSKYLKPLLKLTAMKHVREGVHVVLHCLLSSDVTSGSTYKGLSEIKTENHYSEMDCQLLYKSSKEIVSPWLP